MAICVLIHGTFAKNAGWTQEGSQFRGAIASHFTSDAASLRFETLNWSGWNTRRSRLTAAASLSQMVSRLKLQNPDEDIVLIGHSHGGSVIAYFFKDYPLVAKGVSGAIFLSTPFIAVRLKVGIPDMLNSIVFFGVLFLANQIGGFVLTGAEVQDRVTILDLYLLFVWLPVIARYSAALLFPVLEGRLANNIQKTQTVDFPADQAMVVQMVGDEVAVILSVARAFGVVADWLTQVVYRMSAWLRRFANNRIVKIGRYVFTAILVAEIWWPPLDELTSGQPLISLLFLACSIVGVIYLGTLILLAAAQNVVLACFGWISVLDAIFSEVSVSPAPVGNTSLVNLDWSISADGDRDAISHSRSYTNSRALSQLGDWIAGLPRNRRNPAPVSVEGTQSISVNSTQNIQDDQATISREVCVDLNAITPLLFLNQFTSQIDWEANARALRSGDISELPDAVKVAVRTAAQLPEVVKFSSEHGLDPIVNVVAIMARSVRERSRSAKWLDHRVLWSLESLDLKVLTIKLGFSEPRVPNALKLFRRLFARITTFVKRIHSTAQVLGE